MKSIQELAKIAYDGYCKSIGGTCLFTGYKPLEFDLLPDSIKDAWCDAIAGVGLVIESEFKAYGPSPIRAE